jgi:hypothetical protein
MQGTFELQPVLSDPLMTTYAVENVFFHATNSSGLVYELTGQGNYQMGGEVALVQTLTLSLLINDGITDAVCDFTNDLPNLTRLWPMIQVFVDQTNGTPTHQFHLFLNAAPLREIWFSTAEDFSAAAFNPPTNAIGAGDLLSTAGRVVRNNGALTADLGLTPPASNAGLKDVDILAGGEVAFSLNQDVSSTNLGALHPGDLVSNRGTLLRTNAQLIAAFAPSNPPALGVGLAAVKVMDSGEIYFSVQTGFYSGTLARQIQTGDLLSDSGELIESGQQMLASFQPADPKADYGLAAFYRWPSSGETWFTTVQGFYDQGSNYYSAGDLLSDQGYVVYRNAEILSAFGASGGATGIGLDALFIVTDAVPPRQGATALLLGQPTPTNAPPASLALSWTGGDRVFQLNRSLTLAGPFSPASPIDPGPILIDPGILTNSTQAFYRLTQW